TVGGRIASGLTGIRRLGVGHVREWALGGRLVTARGEAMRFGGPTVKNVTGYDLPRLLCGSWGTLAVLTELTLRVRPLPAFSGWFSTEDPRVGP
ncbi:MAG: glycolate oxidase subunit GlcE, partial [Gemmatimonadetes bacterium]|nr:glycolate oxidase subunit GlcE [Gemmatimonadota bacterium]NIR78824.1 glycolate oxidase subunit GlcE [Gemmatimonadota bacterium]NIT87452.1 glycolate oxidase subunit GlcE [Gemmatimonadota bacterium]NIU31316.1 glycolate oxidase subunit GlcE [Gemmatimonadota bacterium]NIU36015.1 glycolate oxidase subunit GlcE [Gemmatimonadota bacterium]